MKSFTTGLLGVLAGAAIVGGVVWARDDGGSTNSATVAPATTSGQVNTSGSPGAPLTSNDDFTALYDKVRPSIVLITTGSAAGSTVRGQGGGLGSGIVLDKEGHILTNYHVVNGFDTVTITFSDGSTASADVIGKDPGDDTAVVKTDADASLLQPATLGDSSLVKVGSVIAAIGNPFGLEGTFTTGVISGLDRTLTSSANGRPLRGLLQADAAINPGNSGGALINMQGEVIGINTAIENPSGADSFAGVGYAVPINTPKRYLTQLTGGETITHARLGISGKTLTPAELRTLGIEHGVAVASVDSGSGAGQAGIRGATDGTGDVIVALDGNTTKTFDDLADYIDTKAVGDKVIITIHRDGEDTEVTATLKSWDSSA